MVYDMIYAHMVYFCAYACSDKNARESGVGRVQFYASVNRLKKTKPKQKNSGIPKFYNVNLRIQVTTLLVHNEWGSNNMKVSCCPKLVRQSQIVQSTIDSSGTVVP